MTLDTAERGDVRAQRRAFIRGHHPDRGGDPAAFITGLAFFDAQPYPAGGHPQCRAAGVTFYRRRPLPVRLVLAVRHWCHPPPARVQ